LFGVADVELAVDVGDVERGEPGRQGRVGEVAGQGGRLEGLVEDVDGAAVEVGGVEEVAGAVVGKRQPLEDGAGDGGADLGLRTGCGRRHGGVPAGDVAVLGGEDEDGRAAGGAVLDHEIAGGVKYLAGRGAVGDLHHQRVDRDRRALDIAGVE